jgi:integrase
MYGWPVIPRLSEYIRRFPPIPVTLPWHEPSSPKLHGQPVTRELILTRPGGRVMYAEPFQPAVAEGVESGRGSGAGARLNGFHVTRHTFASACLSDGPNPAKVAALLGDTPEVTLSTYAHFLPDDDDRAREILGSFFRPADRPSARNAPREVR